MPQHYSYIEKLITTILVIAAILIIVDIVVMSSILMEKTNAKRNTQKRNEIREKIQQYITAWLMEENIAIDEFMKNEIQNYFSTKQLKNKMFREILYEEIFNANKVLLGEEQKKIKELYTFFGFEKKIKKEFFKYKWYKLVNATNDLLAIKALENSTMFTELLTHPNQFVRLVAIKAEISMGGDQIEILSELRYPLSDWEIYEIISFLKRSQVKRFDNLSKLVNHTEPTVAVLGLQMARMFQELYLDVDFMYLVSHKNHRVRQAAIEYLAECGDSSFLDVLKKMFVGQTEHVQVAILKYIEMHGTDDDVPFIYLRLGDHRPAIQVKAAQTLHNMNLNSSNFLNYLEQSEDKKRQKLAIHVLRNQ
jgi:HEAT repeat protein